MARDAAGRTTCRASAGDGPGVAPDVRLRDPSPDLLALPWDQPLQEWQATEVPLRDVPVGPSRHLVRFVELRRGLLAVKELPARLAVHEYGVLTELRRRRLPAVDPVGVVDRHGGPDDDAGLLVTRFLEHSWQYRRLFRHLPRSSSRHRERLLDAMAALLVDLHRAGVFWGDCSLANTLFVRDGQLLQAHLVDAETSEVHPSGLSDGQRELDLGILTENLMGGLFDVAARTGEVDEDAVVADALSVGQRYRELWDELHRTTVFAEGSRSEVEERLRRLEDLGFVVEEVRVAPSEASDDMELTIAVATRSWHAEELHARTALDVGEGQARILLNDLLAWTARWEAERGSSRAVKDGAARAWVRSVLEPGVERVAAVLPDTDPVQAFCDLLEVRWLLSEERGHDVGDDEALRSLGERRAPEGSAARMSVVEVPTEPLPVVQDDDGW